MNDVILCALVLNASVSIAFALRYSLSACLSANERIQGLKCPIHLGKRVVMHKADADHAVWLQPQGLRQRQRIIIPVPDKVSLLA